MKFTIPKLPFDATALLARIAEIRQRAAALKQSAMVRQLIDEQPALKELLAQGEKIGQAAGIVQEALRQLKELTNPKTLLPVVAK